MALEEIRKHQCHEDDLTDVADKFTPTLRYPHRKSCVFSQIK